MKVGVLLTYQPAPHVTIVAPEMAGLTAEVFCVAISSWWSRRGTPTPRSFMTQTLALTQLSLHPWRCFCWETPCNPCNLSSWAGLFVYLTFAYPLFPGCNAAIFYSKTRPATPAFADYVFVFGLLGGWCFQGSLEVNGHASAMNGIMFAAGAQLVTVFASFPGYEVEVVAHIAAGRFVSKFRLKPEPKGWKIESRKSGLFLEDNLLDLTHLFQIVQSDVKCVVVILSPGVFGSPWCTGEICTAFASDFPKVSFVLDFWRPARGT